MKTVRSSAGTAGRVPAQRGLRHVLGEVAHPLQISGHVQRGDHRPEVGGDRRLSGEQVADPLLDVPVEVVDLGVPLDDRLGGLPVGGEQGPGGLAHGGADALRHVHQQLADDLEVGPELVAHHHVLWSVAADGCRRRG